MRYGREKNHIFTWRFIFPRYAEIRIGPEEAHSVKVVAELLRALRSSASYNRNSLHFVAFYFFTLRPAHLVSGSI